MKEKKYITDDILQYVFLDDPFMDVNITVLLEGKKALLIDSAYHEHAESVLKDLEESNIEVTHIVLSHYHPDHAAGATAIPKAKLICSHLYEENYLKCQNEWDKEHHYRKADEVVTHQETFSFGKHQLKFLETPGHTSCGLSVVINDAFVHVGDLLMTDIQDRPTVPVIMNQGLKHHINSLNMLLDLDVKGLILSHGSLVTKTHISNQVALRRDYLVRLEEGKTDLDEALDHQVDAWSFIGGHTYNLKYI